MKRFFKQNFILMHVIAFFVRASDFINSIILNLSTVIPLRGGSLAPLNISNRCCELDAS